MIALHSKRKYTYTYRVRARIKFRHNVAQILFQIDEVKINKKEEEEKTRQFFRRSRLDAAMKESFHFASRYPCRNEKERKIDR